jgi:hypothetical protein
MKWLAAATLPIALTLLAAPGSTTLADDDETSYVKVEIKGFLRLSSEVAAPPVSVMAARKRFELYLKDIPTGSPTEKQLKEWEDQLVIVRGRLILRDERPPIDVPLVRVTEIEPIKKTPDKK